MDGELSLQFAFVLEPVVDFELILLFKEAAYDAWLAKIFTTVQFNVHQIPVPWQDIPGAALLEKVDAWHVILLEENELVLVFHQRSKQGADPSDEGRWSLLEELELVEHFFEDEVGHIHTQVLGQLGRELDQVLHVVLVLLVQGLLHVLVQLQRKAVVPVDSVQGQDLFVQGSALLIIGLQKVRQFTRSRCESCNAQNHNDDAEYFLNRVGRTDVTVAHSWESGDDEVERCQVKMGATHLLEAIAADPCLFIFWENPCEEDPKACENMANKHAWNYEKGYTVQAIAKLEDPGSNLEDVVLPIHQFDHLEQPCQFDDFANAANLYNTNHTVNMLRFRVNNEKVEGYDGNHVYNEPALNVIASDHRDVIDHLEVFVVECR